MDILTFNLSFKLQIAEIITPGLIAIRLKYMQNETVQDSWFLLLVFAIKAHLRLGDKTIISAS
jgi:hypothetical protein